MDQILFMALHTQQSFRFKVMVIKHLLVLFIISKTMMGINGLISSSLAQKCTGLVT